MEQPHVLDGDHGLVGEGFEQLDLLLGERADLVAADMNVPMGSLGSKGWPRTVERRAASEAALGNRSGSAAKSGMWSVAMITDRPGTESRSIGSSSTTPPCRQRPINGPRTHSFASCESQHHVSRSQTRAALSTIASSTGCTSVGELADDAEHFGSLLSDAPGPPADLRCAPEFLEQAHVLDGDDGLVSEGFEELDLLVRKWSDFGAANHYRIQWLRLAQQRCTEHGSSTSKLLKVPSLGKLRLDLCARYRERESFVGRSSRDQPRNREPIGSLHGSGIAPYLSHDP